MPPSLSTTRRQVLRCGVSAAAVIAAPCTFAQQKQEAGVIRIGQSAGLSGGQAAYSKDVQAALDCCFAAVNKAGGVHGRRIELLTEDDGGKKEQVLANTRKLVEDDKVFALVGYTSGAGVEALLPYLASKHAPMLSPVTGNMGIRSGLHRYLFHTRAGYGDEMRKIVDNMVLIGLRRFAIVYLDDVGPGNPQAAHNALAFNKLSAVAAVPVNRNAENFDAAVGSLVQAAPEMVLFISNARPIQKIVVGMRRAGYKGRFATSSFSGLKLIEDLGADAIGMIFAQVVPSPDKTHLKVVDDFAHDLRTAYPSMRVGYTGLEAYISARVLVEGLRRTGPRPDAERFVSTLEAMRRYDLGGYQVSFSPRSHDGSVFVDTGVVNQDGALRF